VKTLHTKYRPKRFQDVIGQDAIVASLAKIIEQRKSQAFLFSGPSGTGKTTLARIAARGLGCKNAADIMEVDAATFASVEAMREITKVTHYMPLLGSEHRAIIIDEADALSRQAWQSLLKSVEEPPAHVTWFFCTTEAGKVPRTIKTRCTSFTLNSVSDNDLRQLLSRVVGAESIKLSDAIADLVIKEAHGSPRQLLVNLEICRTVTDHKVAATILKSAIDSDATIELCHFVINGGSWTKAMTILGKLSDQSPESVRIVVCNYIGAAIKSAKTDAEACRLLQILDAFATSYHQSDGLSIGRALFGGQA
jgi:DNA polymerase III gamma/tau subunit